MRWLTLLLPLVACVEETADCPAYECPAPVEEPEEGTYDADLDDDISAHEGVAEVGTADITLEYTDADGNAWLVTWPR